MRELLERIDAAKIFDLGQPLFVGMPHYPTHPPFLYSLTKKHGDLVLEGGVSSAADSIAMGTHVGTHIDGLCHFSCGGKLYGGVEAAPLQDYGEGVGALSIDEVPPILRRGVLFDVASHVGMDVLPVDFVITPEHLRDMAAKHRITIRHGDIALLRTGWARYWNDPARFISGGSGAQAAGPGPQIEAARWLSSHRIFAAGSDTAAFERVPSGMPVHVHLLVESGIHIIEALNLEELARENIREFLFIATPLKIRGATGSPIRPVAVA